MKKKKRDGLIKSLGIYVLVFVLVAGMAYFYKGSAPQPTATEISFSEFVKYLSEEQVETLTVNEVTSSNIKPVDGTLKNGKEFKVYVPSMTQMAELDQLYILEQVEEGTISAYTSPEPRITPWYVSLLPTIIIGALMVVFFMMIMRQQGGGNAMAFAKNRARLAGDKDKKVSFKDVAGLEEEKEELAEVVDFLKNPKKYQQLGARIPKGILLVGPPGTGKTYISKATAGEAGVPFFSISGSDFVEMFVGVGASRVRDMFNDAKKNAPCIVFIDEIDAVGRKRGAGIGGGHDEREQTLNQMLVEMDGFGENAGIIVMAATNRPDILDPALLRPGRFDRQIVIGVPDIRGREAIFGVHSANKPLDESVDLKTLAKRTPGYTPADIENIMNEAALITARRNGMKIRMEEIEEAITKVMAGPAKKSRVMNEKERKLTAYHEAGHAIAMRALPESDPVHLITIIPRGRAGGFTEWLPQEERSYVTKGDMERSIIHLLGGRMAEKLTLDDISTGASNDIMRATEVAKDMVMKYGFSDELGPICYKSTDEVFLGNDYHTTQSYSDEVAAKIDNEIHRIIAEGYAEVEKILTEHMDQLVSVAEALLLLENVDGDQFEALYTGELTPEELYQKVQEENEAKAAKNKLEEIESKEAVERAIKEEEEAAGKVDTSDMEEISSDEASTEESRAENEEVNEEENKDEE